MKATIPAVPNTREQLEHRCRRGRYQFKGPPAKGQAMNLERAIQIAAEAHEGQRDKAGEPYVLHPLRVMFGLRSDEERMVGVLHDVVENCDGWSFDRLKAAGFSSTVLDALDSVTRRAGEDYKTFVQRAGANAIGRLVKMADLQDNMNLSRIAEPSERDHTQTAKYREALAYLSKLD
jgi:(p)ppGpp synthase/HD superfamily hydrolase